MDASYEDKMYRQIEKSLSNNINDKLFVPIERIDDNAYKNRKSKQVVDSVSYEEKTMQGEPIVVDNSGLSGLYQDRSYSNNEITSSEYNHPAAIEVYTDDGSRLSRAEYIRQAREACLRQMNNLDTPSRISDNYSGGEDLLNSPHVRKKRDKTSRLFYEGSQEEDLPEEIASFRSLMIRTVCAVVIFISIFIIDKVKMDLGGFSHETIREYVTGNNQLKALEEIIISLLK